tara:strand:+ start:2259 stop:3059 length:801 start_codon:yes stop_codon:yes gene_type:complete
LKPQINFVVALQNEAKPLIEYYKLKLLHHYPFKVYKNENKWLIVSKVGNTMIKKACLHLSEISHSHLNTVWLNIGTAGHLNYPLGTILIANKIIDDCSKATYYPSQIIKENLISTIVRTVEKNVNDYNEKEIFDMEASGFFHICSKISLNELICSIKIISDNKEFPNFNNKLIYSLIKNSLNKLSGIVDQFYKLSEKQCSLVLTNEHFEIFLNKWYFSFTQTSQLKKKLNKLRFLKPKIDYFNESKSYKNSKEVLNFLENELLNHD